MRWKYLALYSPHHRGKPGPKGPSQEIIDSIVELKRRNPRFGYPRIARIISKTFGIEIDRNVARRVLAKHYHPEHGGNGPSRLTFPGHMKDSLWRVDLFRCESIMLKSHWVLVVMDQFTRRIIGFSVYAGDVNSVILCRMFRDVFTLRSTETHRPKSLANPPSHRVRGSMISNGSHIAGVWFSFRSRHNH